MKENFEKSLVLKAVPYSEKHLIVHLLCEKSGKIASFARNARGSKRRFQGGIEPSTFIQAEIKKGSGNLPSLLSSSRINIKGGGEPNLSQIASIFLFCECVDHLVAEHQVIDGLFELAEHTLNAITLNGEKTSQHIEEGIKKLLSLTGFLDPKESVSLKDCIERIEGIVSKPLKSKEALNL